MTKVEIKNPALQTWTGLNKHLMKCEDEDIVEAWLAEELAGRKRKMFIHRLHARLARLRLTRERQELASIQGGDE